MEIRHNRLFCLRENDFKLFFSMVDYLNSFFMSSNPEDLIKFYSFFKDRESLIKWTKERPKGNCEIREVEGDKNIIVVIPTVDFDGEYARNCREEIFKGLHIVFVVSGKNNFYFNYAHNCNAGIKKALEYNPKWIVLSNDDMYRIDDPSILVNELAGLDSHSVRTVFTRASEYHSFKMHILRNDPFTENLNFIIDFGIWMKRHNFAKMKNILIIKIVNFRFKKYLRYMIKSPGRYFGAKLISRIKGEGYTFINAGAFSIFSGEWVKEKMGEIFDETYINGVEDVDLSIELNEGPLSFIEYRIGDQVGASLGRGDIRYLRNIVNNIYFNEKLMEFLNERFRVISAGNRSLQNKRKQKK